MANKDNTSFIASIVTWLSKPVAIGTYLTFIFSLIGFYYYKPRAQNKNIVLDFIERIDQNTIDYRFILRGPKPPSPQVAVLAVDDRSLEIQGRWPWPRDKMARAIKNTFDAGAKVIGADITWSEPSDRPEVRFAEALKTQITLPPPIQNLVETQIALSDPDQKYVEILNPYKAQFVYGSYYLDNSEHWYSRRESDYGYTDFCYDYILTSTTYQTVQNKQSESPIARDAFIEFLPEALSEAFKLHLSEIENTYREKQKTSAQLSRAAIYNLENEILGSKINYCKYEFLNPERDSTTKSMQENWAALLEQLPELKYSSFDEWIIHFRERNLVNAIPNSLLWQFNIPQINENSSHFAYFNAHLDQDGKIRKAQLVARAGTTYMPALALKSYLVANQYNMELLIDAHDKVPGLKSLKSISINDSEGQFLFQIPAEADGKMYINYRGARHSIPHVSLADMLDEQNDKVLVTQKVRNSDNQWLSQENLVIKKDFLKDRILILGVTAMAVYDLRVTPFDENFPGVETHANTLDNIISRDFLTRHKNEEWLMPLAMLVLGLIFSLIVSSTGALFGFILTSLILSILLFFDQKFLFSKGHLVSIILPTLQVALSYVFLTFYKYFKEERAKKELRATFSKYVSPAIVEEVLKDPKNLELGGRKENITVFFSDVRGFTTISEKLTPLELSDLLNSYLTPMTELVFKYRGTLDKYMGDAVMAFFGAPIPYPDHAKMACLCALASLRKLEELKIEYAAKGLPLIDIGIGLNTGDCSVGNMGSQTVRNYTVMGDAVNLASRLEGINKSYGTRIIISEFTYAEVKNDFLCREVDWVQVKGKNKPVKIYELIHEMSAPDHLAQMAKHFDAGYKLYREQKFATAIEHFTNAIKVNPNDDTSKIYIERCQDFVNSPPDTGWDGVYVMKTK